MYTSPDTPYILQFCIWFTIFIILIPITSSEDPAVQGYMINDLSGMTTAEIAGEIAVWKSQGLVNPNVNSTACGSRPYLGGKNTINYGGYYERTYAGLPDHDIIYYDFKIYIIGRWNPTDSFSITFDGKLIMSNINAGVYESSFSGTSCGSSPYKALQLEFIGRAFHTAPTLTVRLISNIALSPLNGGFAVRAFSFLLGHRKPGEQESFCASKSSTSTSFTDWYVCPCITGEYLDSTTGCSSCNTNCRDCYGASQDECFSYIDGFGFDGTHMITCGSNCDRCISPTECIDCDGSYIAKWDHTCVTTCTSPHVLSDVGYKRCLQKCQAQDMFTLWDNSCSPSCDPPLTQSAVGYAQYCKYGCTSATNFLRWDGVCVSTCDPPAIQVVIAGKNLCKYPCQDLSDFILSNGTCILSCNYPFTIVIKSDLKYCIFDISEGDAKQAQQAAQISTAISDATNLGGAIITMLTFNNPGLLLMGSMTEMLQYIQYLDIQYPLKLYLMLQDQDVNAGGINIITQIPPEVEQAIPNRPLPPEFQTNDTQSSYVANSWGFLVSLCLVAIGLSFTLGLRTCTKTHSKIASALTVIVSSLKWNLLLGIFCSSYGFSGMFTALEFRTVNMDSGLSILSFVICLFINVIGFFVLFQIVQLSVFIQTIRRSKISLQEKEKEIEELEKKWGDYEVLFGEYKNDHLSQKMYLFIFMIRTYLHYAVLGYLNDYTFTQTVLFTIMSLLMMAYLIIRRPMKSKTNFAQQILCEIAILIVNVSVLIFASMEKWEVDNSDIKEKIGDIVVGVNLGLSFLSSVFLAIESVSKIIEAWKFVKKWFQENRKSRKKDFIHKYHKKISKPANIRPERADQQVKAGLEVSDLDIIQDCSQMQLKPQEFS